MVVWDVSTCRCRDGRRSTGIGGGAVGIEVEGGSLTRFKGAVLGVRARKDASFALLGAGSLIGLCKDSTTWQPL